MISTLKTIWIVALIVCCSALAMAQNTETSNATTAPFSPILMVAGGAALVGLGLAVGFLVGKGANKKG